MLISCWLVNCLRNVETDISARSANTRNLGNESINEQLLSMFC